MAWDTSTRRQRLPGDWRKRRRGVLRRDGYRCQHQGCHHHDPTGATLQVDHVVPNDDHSRDNLQTLCEEHHKRKTITERRQPRNRPTEPHPGLVNHQTTD